MQGSNVLIYATFIKWGILNKDDLFLAKLFFKRDSKIYF